MTFSKGFLNRLTYVVFLVTVNIFTYCTISISWMFCTLLTLCFDHSLTYFWGQESLGFLFFLTFLIQQLRKSHPLALCWTWGVKSLCSHFSSLAVFFCGYLIGIRNVLGFPPTDQKVRSHDPETSWCCWVQMSMATCKCKVPAHPPCSQGSPRCSLTEWRQPAYTTGHCITSGHSYISGHTSLPHQFLWWAKSPAFCLKRYV